MCSRAIYVCLRVSYSFLFSFFCLSFSVDCLCPCDDVQRFQQLSKIFVSIKPKILMFSPMLRFVKNVLFYLRVLSSIGFKKSFREYNQQARRSRFHHDQVSFLLFSWFSAYFWYLLSINFGFQKFVHKLVIALSRSKQTCQLSYFHYFTYSPFFFVLIELKLCSMPLAHFTIRLPTILFFSFYFSLLTILIGYDS